MTHTPRARVWAPLPPRDPHEPGRTASSLELFFDLVFVVAVSIAAANLHHALTEDHILDGVSSFAVVFFGIWWAWMNFTWFATSFDTDDWLYRVLTVVQMAGVLVLAAGVEPAFSEQDYRLLVYGYVLMRVAMVAQWIRAARHGGPSGRAALMYAVGISVLQVLWLIMLALPHDVAQVVLVVLVLGELAVPVVAERTGRTTWHPHHITERYGLFTLILLGESLLASSNAIIEAVHEDQYLGQLIPIAVATLILTASLWWIYFWPAHHRAITGFGQALRYGYVHYFVFAAAAAFSAGVEVQLDVITHHSHLDTLAAGFTVSLPLAVFMAGIWWISMASHGDQVVNLAVPGGALLVLASPLLHLSVTAHAVLTAVVLVVVVVVLVARPADEPAT